jgi:DNA-binding transcriptional ArsR family regulator
MLHIIGNLYKLTNSNVTFSLTMVVFMDSIQQARYEARAAIIKALAHPTRLFIVEELRNGERCVCDMTALIGDDISTVSRHLAILKNTGIVEDNKRGNQVFYTLKVPCVLNFFGCIEAVLESNMHEKTALCTLCKD